MLCSTKIRLPWEWGNSCPRMIHVHSVADGLKFFRHRYYRRRKSAERLSKVLFPVELHCTIEGGKIACKGSVVSSASFYH